MLHVLRARLRPDRLASLHLHPLRCPCYSGSRRSAPEPSRSVASPSPRFLCSTYLGYVSVRTALSPHTPAHDGSVGAPPDDKTWCPRLPPTDHGRTRLTGTDAERSALASSCAQSTLREAVATPWLEFRGISSRGRAEEPGRKEPAGFFPQSYPSVPRPNPPATRQSSVEPGRSAASPSAVRCSTYFEYASARTASAPCISARLAALGARAAAGFGRRGKNERRRRAGLRPATRRSKVGETPGKHRWWHWMGRRSIA